MLTYAEEMAKAKKLNATQILLLIVAVGQLVLGFTAVISQGAMQTDWVTRSLVMALVMVGSVTSIHRSKRAKIIDAHIERLEANQQIPEKQSI